MKSSSTKTSRKQKTETFINPKTGKPVIDKKTGKPAKAVIRS